MRHFLFLCLFATQTLLVAEVEIHHNPLLLEYANTHLSHFGFLKKTDDGFVYVKVSNAFINQLLPLLNQSQVKTPPYFGPNRVGAHISVIRDFEITNPKTLHINELGKKVFFEISDLCSVKPLGFPGCKKVWFLQVRCPELEQLRERLGFSPKIAGHEFHITIGIEKEKQM